MSTHQRAILLSRSSPTHRAYSQVGREADEPIRLGTRRALASSSNVSRRATYAMASRTGGHDALEEKLGRLLTKPGVKASIILDRASGAIVKTSGDVSALRTARARDAATAASFSNEVPAAEESESRGIEDFATMVHSFVAASDQLVQDVDKEDELRLLRLRTRKQEVVIVPDAKYLLTVIHDTSSA